MAALLVLYILIGAALVALGVFLVAGQIANRRKDGEVLPPQRKTSGSSRV